MDPHIDGVVPTPMSQDEKDFLSGNLRRIHAAYDDAGCDLSALPAKAADMIERLRDWGTKDSLPAEAADEIDRLRGEVRVLRGSHDWLSREKERLESAIRRTLDENGHLADGDNCTLIHLVRAMPTADVTPNVEVTGAARLHRAASRERSERGRP